MSGVAAHTQTTHGLVKVKVKALSYVGRWSEGSQTQDFDVDAVYNVLVPHRQVKFCEVLSQRDSSLEEKKDISC